MVSLAFMVVSLEKLVQVLGIKRENQNSKQLRQYYLFSANKKLVLISSGMC